MLAKSGQPLVLADGTKIDPLTGGLWKDETAVVEIPSQTEAQKIVTKTRRTVADLPELPETMNPINVVLCYDMFGLDNAQIAVATRLTVEQVESIKSHAAYDSMRAAVYRSMSDSAANDVSDILNRGRKKAANKIVDLIDSTDDELALKAANAAMTHSKDARDAADMPDLEIRIVRRGAAQTPSININVGD